MRSKKRDNTLEHSFRCLRSRSTIHNKYVGMVPRQNVAGIISDRQNVDFQISTIEIVGISN
jgi:hypothetical protein